LAAVEAKNLARLSGLGPKHQIPNRTLPWLN